MSDMEQEESEKKEAPQADEEVEFEGEENFEVDDWAGDDDWDEADEDDEDEQLELLPDLVDNGNGTVSDPRRHLMWARTDSQQEYGYGINWYEANDYIEELNEKKFAGFDDWRMCSMEEASWLFSFSVSNTDKDGAEVHYDPLFESGGGHNTWTYEEKPDYAQYAMNFSYITGNEKWEHKDNEYCHVRAVRDEIKEEWEPAWRKESQKFEG